MTNEILNDEQLDKVAGGNIDQPCNGMNGYIYCTEIVGDNSQQPDQVRPLTEDQTIAANNYKSGHFIL